MKYIKNTTEFYIEENTVLSLGKFDGIHRGHELLLSHMAAKKKRDLQRRFSPLIFRRAETFWELRRRCSRQMRRKCIFLSGLALII